jgi:hypothetical protein
MQNDREIRAREGDLYLQNNKKHHNIPPRRSSVVDRQPKLKQQMVAPGLFNMRRYPQGLPTQDIDNFIPIDPINSVTEQPPNNSIQSINNTTGQPQGNTVRLSELAIGKTQGQAREVMPIVVVTGPEDSTRVARGISVEHLPYPLHESRDQLKILNQEANCPESSNTPSSDHLSREHVLVECPILETRDEVNIQLGQDIPLVVYSTTTKEVQKRKLDSHALVACATPQATDEVESQFDQESPLAMLSAPTKEIQDRGLDSHALSDCSPMVELSPATTGVVQQHVLTECHNSPTAMPEIQELSCAHELRDCPGEVLDYYKEGAKKAQEHDFAYCAGQNSSSAKSERGVPEHFLDDCTPEMEKNGARHCTPGP